MKTFLTITFCICLTALAGDPDKNVFTSTNVSFVDLSRSNAVPAFAARHRPHVFMVATNDPAWSAAHEAELRRLAADLAYAHAHSETNSLTHRVVEQIVTNARAK
jgi:hypothetical protein